MTGIIATLAGYPSAVSGGGGGSDISITDQLIYDATSGTAQATYQIGSDGKVRDQSLGILESWLLGGTASNYEVRATVTSGSLSAGTSGSWLNCGTTRTWTVRNSAMNNSVLTCVMTVEIRLASSGVVQDSATITLEAESDNFS